MSALKSPLVRLRGLIAAERTLAVLLPEAERMQALNTRLAKAVPPAVARACRVVALDGETARIYCSNGSAAARLRSSATRIAGALASADQPVSDLKVKVRADWSLPQKPEKPGMARQGITAWAELEQKLPDGDLKAAIDHLVRHQRK
jgi:hypothetical protein